MNLYLDDDSASHLLIRLLMAAAHDVLVPANVGQAGNKDASHLIFAIRYGRILLTHNHDDSELLHELVLLVGGHHPGVLVVRKDKDRKRDLTAKESSGRFAILMPRAFPYQISCTS